ncbi:farnesyl-diphosphate synthase [Bacillus australimaris]|uniref:Farnesyl-diphosphate synthase n=1 Tax=Bacillus australimaris TaxID=1326968 RepID=A0ABR5MYB6_9BACI|nr:farnesyl diphosphate synthase [Bacillus australimaris]KPN15562.1 farnesyl-diphosphate synthase [Bacillus australimaris]
MTSNLHDFLTTRKKAIEDYLFTYVQELNIPEDLKSSMLYSLKAGGKRLRPVLVLALLHAYGKNEEDGIPVGCAVEMIHTYSLIHDDLPCMDDDDLRRGKPTNHKVYGEATAVLAGDALLTESFRLITSQLSSSVSADQKLRIIDELVKSAGALGMVGGQFDDMEAEQNQVPLAELESIHARKTGKLLTFSVAAGAMLAGASNDDIEKLREFSYHIGIAFQIRDDILDLEGSEEKIGKRVGSDTANEKSTYPSLLTLSGAKEKLNEHITRAKEIVSNLKLEQQLLHELCDLIASRDH